jgi:hypothetical protein
MPIDFTDAGYGAVFRCHGAVTGEEILERNRQLLSTEGPERWLFGVIDYADAASVENTAPQLKAMALQYREVASRGKPGVVVAIVASQELENGLAAMWRAFADETGWRTRVLRSREEAVTWVRDEVRKAFGVEVAVPLGE